MKDMPDNELHYKSDNSCSLCHTTESWRNIIFNHNEHFRFDKHHKPECNTCHGNKKNFTQYTCYGCHTHSPRKIVREHKEEGIFNFSNCSDCHKSGNEDEAGYFWKAKNKQKRRASNSIKYIHYKKDDDSSSDD